MGGRGRGGGGNFQEATKLKLKKHIIRMILKMVVSENQMPDKAETGRDRKFHCCGNCFVLALAGNNCHFGKSTTFFSFWFKTSPQVKRHKPSLLFTHLITFITR